MSYLFINSFHHRLCSRLLWPRPGADGGRAQLGCGVGQNHGSLGSSRPAAPSRARCQRLLAASQGCAGRGGQCWPHGAPGTGAGPAPSAPSWRSLQLAEDKSRAAEHLRHALQYLDSPQESLRQAAIRFIGMAGRHLRGHKRQLRHICQALEDKAEDISPATRSLALKTAFVFWAVERAPGSILQKLQDQFCRARKKWPCLWGHRWLCCWGSEES
ncbi:uncharacterized protein LOC121357314 [Pyrgilauda ruficollis]|uniref:uncharacterized protein LOC121357314 n=1 Tax=Pyrgilauda ruficollis TaxID=221976 RepID=UPI001B874AC8|nr:uncharacterized protein LOC121357314 [Pyrgilauda ruficollis]